MSNRLPSISRPAADERDMLPEPDKILDTGTCTAQSAAMSACAGSQPLDEAFVVSAEGLSMPRRAINKAREIRHKLPRSVKIKLKILFSVLMFATLPMFLKIDLNKTWAAVLHTNPWIMGGTALVFLGTVLMNARRWQIITDALGFTKRFAELAEYCYVGMFFNLFLPSTVGGDFSRCYYISKGTGKYAQALYSVLADRASGIAVLFASATIGICLSPGARELPWQLKWPVFVGALGLFCIMPFMPALTRRVLGDSHWITRQFNNSSAQVFWKDKRLVMATLSWSLVTQLIMVLCHIGVAAALGIADKLPLWYYFVFYPCVAVLGFVTPSFNGIGIREWAYTYFLVLMHVDRATALTYALMWLALTTLLSLVGGMVYVGAKLAPPPPQEED
jgi:uncharacterized membrane protein YbhN (UPF0104 family)